jgi:hypothetical protein
MPSPKIPSVKRVLNSQQAIKPQGIAIRNQNLIIKAQI